VQEQALQNMVKNPNGVLQQALQASLQGTSMKSKTFLNVSTTNSIIKGGGGTANSFPCLQPQSSTRVRPGCSRRGDVWIETIAGTGGNPDIHQLQYTQLVMLDFFGIHWPHVTVGTLRKR
jgi:hypothetical protein